MASKHGRKYSIELNRKTKRLLLPAALLAGVITGAVMANTMDNSIYTELSEFIKNFLFSFSTSDIKKSDIFIENLVKYGKTLVLIWTLGFISIGFIFVYFLMFIKGVGYGFTTALIIRVFGVKGLLYITALYVPQNLILIPVYFIVSYFSLNYMYSSKIKTTNQKIINLYLKEYIIVFFICAVLILCAVLIEVFIVPKLLLPQINLAK